MDTYIYCQKCFADIPGDTVTLMDEFSSPQSTQVVKKSQFVELKNDYLEHESFVECSDCDRKFHHICVMHFPQIWPEGFTCDNCLANKGKRRKENKHTSKRLSQSKLSEYIENRVNIFLKRQESGAGYVTIRVLSSSEKNVEVKPEMKAKFVDTGEFPPSFPYKAKALFAFEEIDGVDVCFFGMHVQEYGSEAAAPNSRRVYIAYLDSVHFFQPKQYRTAVYHEILLGYLSYVKQLGYTMAHIWACPPSEGDDYIFHCHPAEQKIPKPKKLQEWYKRMLDKGVQDKIIVDYKDILRQATDDGLESATEMPYFDDDFWPNILEESIKELDQEDQVKRKAEEEAVMSDPETSEEVHANGKKNGQKSSRNKKSSKSKSNHKKNKKLSAAFTGNDLTAKIYSLMEKHKEVFFVIRLQKPFMNLPPIIDPDSFVNCELMDGRDAFLTLARDKHFEFSSLRRTKYSTMAILYELHHQFANYTCNNCDTKVQTRYNCATCDDYDLCIGCYQKLGHEHKMVRLGLGLEEDLNSGQKVVNPEDAKKNTISRCVQSLEHASYCRDANCRLVTCVKIKKLLTHYRGCQKKKDNCLVCKQLLALSIYHAKNCKETKCPVALCSVIKGNIQKNRIMRQQVMRRRVAAMQCRGSGESVSQPSPGSSTSTVSQSPSPHPSLPSIGMKPTNCPPMAALQAVQEVQAAAARQTVPNSMLGTMGSYNASNVGHALPSPSMPGQHQKPMNHMMARNPDNMQGMRNPQWMNSTYTPSGQPQNMPYRQMTPHMQPTVSPRPPNHSPNMGVPMGSQGMPSNPQLGNKTAAQQLQLLLQALKSPSSPTQQLRVREMLKANPQLMAFVIKQQQRHQMPQNQLQQPQPDQMARMPPQQQGSWYGQQQQQPPMQRPVQQGHMGGLQPPAYSQHSRMMGHHGYIQQQQQGYAGDKFQQFPGQPMRHVMPPASPQQPMYGMQHPDLIPTQQQQMLQNQRSPQPIASPRTQTMQSPRLAPSPHYSAQPTTRPGMGGLNSTHNDMMGGGRGDMMFPHLANRLSPHPSASQLLSPVNQDLGFQPPHEQLDKSSEERLEKLVEDL